MNIFILDEDPSVAAYYMCDKHINKMILESAQMMCTVARWNGFEAPYREAFGHHPCTIWAGATNKNWQWLADHTLAMINERRRRGYNSDHKSAQVIWRCIMSRAIPDEGPLTPFAQAMPEQYKVKGDAVRAYRQYYIHEKARFAKWRAGNVPNWWPHAV